METVINFGSISKTSIEWFLTVLLVECGTFAKFTIFFSFNNMIKYSNDDENRIYPSWIERIHFY